jgi:heme/copper-type cytochrome/quinol oxidase subunit 1
MYIGGLYILLGLLGGSMGYGLSVLIRMELSCSGYVLMSWWQYNATITFHGIFMIFFMIMPVLIGGFGNVLVPLCLAIPDMIFPRLNSLSVWLSITAFYLIILALVLNGGANAG